MSRGAAGEWDAVDVLNPSVIRQGDAYYNFFSGYDGKTWHTGLAVSADGVTWRKEGKILSSAGNGSAIADDNGIFVLLPGRRSGRRSASRDRGTATNGQRNGAPVLPVGPYGSWDERGVADPYVIRAGRSYYMFYLGMDRARRQRLGVAMSGRWRRAGTSCAPIRFWSWANTGHSTRTDWASRRFGPRADITGCCTRGAIATKCGGWAWRVRAMACVGRSFRWSLRASRPWDSKVICDPTVIANGDRVTVWFGGGDVAQPRSKHPWSNWFGRR